MFTGSTGERSGCHRGGDVIIIARSVRLAANNRTDIIEGCVKILPCVVVANVKMQVGTRVAGGRTGAGSAGAGTAGISNLVAEGNGLPLNHRIALVDQGAILGNMQVPFRQAIIRSVANDNPICRIGIHAAADGAAFNDIIDIPGAGSNNCSVERHDKIHGVVRICRSMRTRTGSPGAGDIVPVTIREGQFIPGSVGLFVQNWNRQIAVFVIQQDFDIRGEDGIRHAGKQPAEFRCTFKVKIPPAAVPLRQEH